MSDPKIKKAEEKSDERKKTITEGCFKISVAFPGTKRSDSLATFKEYNLDSHYYTTSYKTEIKRKHISFLSKCVWLTCLCFPPTGIPSLILIHKMRKHYFASDYQKAIKYMKLAKLFAYLNIVLAIVGIFAFLVLSLVWSWERRNLSSLAFK